MAMRRLPVGGIAPPLSFSGDLVVLAGLVAVGRFVTVLAALDTGSSFEGMGASREVHFAALAEPALLLAPATPLRGAGGASARDAGSSFGGMGGSREVHFAALAEPALLVALATLVRVTGGLSLSGIYGAITPATWAHALPALALVAMTLVVLALVENTRIPVDDPTTHLELTMIHEVMVLDHSGPDLGLIHYAAALKLWILGTLFVGLVVSVRSGSLWLDGAAALVGMAGLALIIGIVESAMARYRLVRVPQFIVGAATLSVVAFIVLLA